MDRKNNIRTPLIYVILFAILIMAALFFGDKVRNPNGDEIEYTEFLRRAEDGEIEAVMLSQQDYKLFGISKGSKREKKDLPGSYDFFVITRGDQVENDLKAIVAEKLNVEAQNVNATQYGFDFLNKKPSDNIFLNLVPYLIMLVGLGFVFFYVMRQQSGGNGITSFGKSKARIITGDANKITFADVAGADEEKEELSEIVEFLKSPKRFDAMGARIPKGVLLMGPPGTGKTLLAKAVSGEAGVPFYSISGSDFVEMFVGVGASRVRDLFTTAKRTAPAIIFIDEIDAVGRQRGAGLGGGHDEREQTLNQLLVEMDGFDSNSGIIVIAATNRPDILDPALLRPGRFDRQVVVNRPDVKGREEILKVHQKDKPLAADVNLSILAQRTPGFTGADLENVLNEAAILAVRAKKDSIDMSEVEEAVTRVIAGPEKKSRVIDPDDKRLTAYHEAGHGLCARQLPGCDNVHEISIIPRGRSGGHTMTLPDKDTSYMPKNKLLDQLAMFMGGRAAEAVYIGDISTGAYGDFQQATETARQMVKQYGMSDKIGHIFLDGETETFMGRDFGQPRPYSEEVASLVDSEVSKLLEDAYKRAEDIVRTNRDAMEATVKVLLEKERISGDEFNQICNSVNLEAPPKNTIFPDRNEKKTDDKA